MEIYLACSDHGSRTERAIFLNGTQKSIHLDTKSLVKPLLASQVLPLIWFANRQAHCEMNQGVSYLILPQLYRIIDHSYLETKQLCVRITLPGTRLFDN